MIKIPFDNSYAHLPDDFYTKTSPTPVEHPQMIMFNQSLANALGLEIDPDEQGLAAVFAGNKIPEGAEPIAMAYAGHQFGGFSHQLGDGRAILLGEVIGRDGKRYDMQLKGSGPTPWSRSGDGRSALGPVLREYLVSEAMAKLGVPTTRALAAVTTGEEVARNTLVPGGILTRVASGFVRVGTFEYFSARRNVEAIRQLADYEIKRHYPEAKGTNNPYAAFLSGVVERQARLIAQWMGLGFIHGVMNTDNMSIAGETIDYGPCAFMDEFSYDRVYSSIDRNGRYAYKQQAQIGQWNLIRLAESLVPLLADETQQAVSIAQDILNNYQSQYEAHWLLEMRKKLGLFTAQDNDQVLIDELLDCMEKNSADFTLVFYYLSLLENQAGKADDVLRQLFNQTEQLDTWLVRWRERLAKETPGASQRQARMKQTNPVYIPRNHQIEAAIRAAEDHNDFSVFDDLHKVLQNPFTLQQGKDQYMLPPSPEQVVHQTFCGT
jgi:uncharacterized protein YdiU (UPF0061 family)